jgi:hypothetical protein
MHEGEWLLYADVDEFARFPCDLASRMRAEVAFCARMVDRLAADLSLPPLRAGPLDAQFPLCVPVRGSGSAALVNANDAKVVLLRARIRGAVPRFVKSHGFLLSEGNGSSYHGLVSAKADPHGCSDLGLLDHFTWSQHEARLLAGKLRVYERLARVNTSAHYRAKSTRRSFANKALHDPARVDFALRTYEVLAGMLQAAGGAGAASAAAELELSAVGKALLSSRQMCAETRTSFCADAGLMGAGSAAAATKASSRPACAACLRARTVRWRRSNGTCSSNAQRVETSNLFARKSHLSSHLAAGTRTARRQSSSRGTS